MYRAHRRPTTTEHRHSVVQAHLMFACETTPETGDALQTFATCSQRVLSLWYLDVVKLDGLPQPSAKCFFWVHEMSQTRSHERRREALGNKLKPTHPHHNLSRTVPTRHEAVAKVLLEQCTSCIVMVLACNLVGALGT